MSNKEARLNKMIQSNYFKSQLESSDSSKQDQVQKKGRKYSEEYGDKASDAESSENESEMSFEILDEINDVESLNSQSEFQIQDTDDEWEVQQDKANKTKEDAKYRKLQLKYNVLLADKNELQWQIDQR